MSKKLHIVTFLLYLHSLNQKRELALKVEGLQFQKSLFFLKQKPEFLEAQRNDSASEDRYCINKQPLEFSSIKSGEIVIRMTKWDKLN